MNNNGSLPMALMIIVVLMGLSSALLLRSVNENKLVKRVGDSTSALWMAESGVQKVLWEYNYNSCQGMVREGTNTACVSCTNCGAGSKTLAGTLNAHGDYDVTLDLNNTTIQSVGSVPSRSAANVIQRRVQTTMGKPAIFANGIFAQGQITLSNNSLVDSYNSSNGPYGGANVNHNGNVGTNGITNGVVTINNNAEVYGHISTGPGGTVVTGNGVTLSDPNFSNANSVPLPAVVVPPTLTSLSSSGALSVANNASTTISSGDYKYTNISLGNHATLNITGNVRLYLTGTMVSGVKKALDTGTAHVTVNIANGASLTVYTDGKMNFDNNSTININSLLPTNFLIYSTYTGTNGITINNNSTTYAGIYAPQTDINISNNAGFFGSVVGKTTILDNNGEVHYDEALATMSNPFENAIVGNWTEY